MKKFLSIVLAVSMLLALASCGNDTAVTSSNDISEIVSDTSSTEETSSEETSSVEEPVSKNLALNKKVYFSSQNIELSMFAKNAVDGEENTSWSSNTTEEAIDEWITVDLGANYDLESITIKWGMSRALDFEVEVSRGGIEFEKVHSAEGVQETEDVVTTNRTARFVRINCKKVPSVLGSFMGATIKEIEVLGTLSEDKTLGSEKEAMVFTKEVIPTENDVYVMGRNYKFNQLIWAGATYEYKCTGAVAGAVLFANKGSENIRFEVSIDGGDFVLYTLGGGVSTEFIFADDLDPTKEHTVCIMKTGDVWEPALTVESVLVSDDGKIVENYTREYDLKIEFIGDSITSGGVTNGYAKSYVYLTAKALNAHFHAVSRSGQGLYKHANFGTPGPLKSLYAGIGSETGDYQYGYDADLVVLNIGTNDGANVRNSETEADKKAYRDTFTAMYVEMLEKIHEANPDAIILCTGGLMGDIGQVKSEIKTAVDTFKAENPDVKVYLEYLSTAKDCGPDTSWHPGIEGHAKGAEELIAIIKNILK